MNGHTPFFRADRVTLWQGDVLATLATLPEKHVQLIISSPPYIGLRDYKIPKTLWTGGSECDGKEHAWTSPRKRKIRGEGGTKGSTLQGRHRVDGQDRVTETEPGDHCWRCGAWTGCHGLEPTPELWIRHEVEIFRAMRRVLRDDGTIWWNVGDSYAGSGGAHSNSHANPGISKSAARSGAAEYRQKSSTKSPGRGSMLGGNLLHMPDRLAIALQADGWILRSKIIWAKGASFLDRSGSVMPESMSGWTWGRCRVKVKQKEIGYQPASAQFGRPDHSGPNLLNMTEWTDCPSCPKCAPNDGLVLRKGSWRPTSAYEVILMLAKSPNYFCDGESIAELSGPSDNIREDEAHLYQMPSIIASGLFPQGEADEDRLAGEMQGLRKDVCVRLPSEPEGGGGHSGDPSKVSSEPKGKGEPGQKQSIGEGQGSNTPVEAVASGESVHRSVSKVVQAKSGARQIQQKPKGKGHTTEKLRDRVGSGSSGASDTQETGTLGKLPIDSDARGMGRDQEETEAAVRLLQAEDETSHDGSRHPVDEERTPREGEHRGSLPVVQRAQGKQSDQPVLAHRNLRNVWRINTAPNSMGICKICKAVWLQNAPQKHCESHPDSDPDGKNVDGHFATFPPKLIEPIVKASTPEAGSCAECGAPWARVVERGHENPGNRTTNGPRSLAQRHETAGFSVRLEATSTTLGHRRTCGCKAKSRPAVVLDPFSGSGTTLSVARKLGCEAWGIEINPEYCSLAAQRLGQGEFRFG